MQTNYKHGSNGMPVPYEPKQTNRFVVIFPDEFEISPYVIFKVSPIIMIGMSMKAEPIVFSMYDAITPSTSAAINEGLRKLRKSDNKTIKIKINSIGPVGDVVEEWILDGCITHVDFGNYDWNVDEKRIITLEFDVQQAIHNY